MGKKRKRRDDTGNNGLLAKKQTTEPPLPEGVFHYDYLSEVPWDYQNYWRQRHQIFSRYDEGVWMTDESWYSVTPECVATKIASDMAEGVPDGRSIMVDAFCGAGGNTIAFALSGKWKRVYAIEKDPATLECAKHNAKVYGVHDLITWFLGDCFEILATDEEKKQNAVEALRAVIGEYGVLFASPPWGGPEYKSQEVFDLDLMVPYSCDHIVRRFGKVTKNMVLYLPRTSDLRQIADHVENGSRAQIVHYCQNGRSRALCAYLGDWKVVNGR